jgi:5-(carboxyamino)imidazole ribonucleotide synthase
MQVAEHGIVAAYDDPEALQKLADNCDAVTTEFENVPASSLELVAKTTRVYPPAAAVSIAQDRHKEKTTATAAGLQPVNYAVITEAADIDAALSTVNLPAILKTSRMGYDGKGQQTCESAKDVRAAFAAQGGVTCVLEERIELEREISVVLARGSTGESVCFPVAENVHTNGILDTTVVPSSAPKELLTSAQHMAVRFADSLDYVGVLAIEFFVTTDNQILFNEMAPRPHNSGHYTLDATAVCQFEQQLRALCALPLGSTELLSPVCMLNVLGDSWPDGGIPDWQAVMRESGAHLHLYGKAAARPGRKMGHINCLQNDADQALALAMRLRKALAQAN